MSILTRPIEELLRYLLTRLHGGFLLSDLDHRNFHTNVSEGIYTLKDLKLNPSAINQNLSESSLHLFSCSISRLTLQVPNVFRFLEDPLHITMHHLTLDLCSANESGFSVIPEEKTQVSSEEDFQGLNVLTKSIGNFLSKTSFQVSLVQVRIRSKPSDSQFLQITIPKVSFMEGKNKDDSCVKLMKIEGLRVNLMEKEGEIYDPHEFSNLSVLEEPVEIEMSLTKDMLFVNCVVSKLCVLISLEQAKFLVQLASSLQKSQSFDKSRVSVLSETLQALGDDIKELPKMAIREKVVKVHLASAVLCVTLEEGQPFSKKWSYFDGAYPGVPASHIVLVGNQIVFSHSKRVSLKISKIFANHFNYLQAAALDTSELFATAKGSYFNEFFSKRPAGQFWEADLNKCHFCIGNVLQVRRSNTEFNVMQPVQFRPVKTDIKLTLTEGKIQITCGAIEIHTNKALLNFLNLLLSVSRGPPSKLPFSISLSIPVLRIDYQEIFDKCFCQGHEWMLISEASWINLQSSESDSNLTVSNCEISMFADEILTNVLTCQNLKLSRQIKEGSANELLQESKEHEQETYYEPNQGTISVRKTVEAEPFDLQGEKNKKKNKEISSVEEELALAKALCVTRIFVNKIVARLEPSLLNKMVKLIPNDKEKKDPWPVASVVQVNHFNVEFLEKDTSEGKNLAPCMFSYYSLDASLSRTVNIVSNSAVPVVIVAFTSVKLLSMENCIRPSHKYSKITAGTLNAEAKNQELFYSTSNDPLEVTVSSGENEETSVKVLRVVFCFDVFLTCSEFLAGFQIDLPKGRSRVDKKKVSFDEVFIDLTKEDKRILSFIRKAAVEVMSIDSNSLAVHGQVESSKSYFSENIEKSHPLFEEAPKDVEAVLLDNGYSVLATLDSLDMFLTIVSPKSAVQSKPPGDSYKDTTSCILGCKNCQKLFEPFYLAKEVRTLALVNRLIDLQVNLGSVFLHIYPGTSDFLTFFLENQKNQEKNDEFFKESSKESDEQEKIPVSTAGVLVSPLNPGKVVSINLQDYLNPSKISEKSKERPLKQENPEILQKISIIHCHSVPPNSSSKQSKDDHFRLKPSHGFPSIQLKSTIFLLVLNIYSKTPHPRCPNRTTMSQVSIRSNNISINFHKFPQELHYSWRLTLSIGDLQVHDLILASSVKYLLKKDLSCHQSLSVFALFEVSAVWPRPDLKSDTELVVYTALAPLKLSIDQHFIDFALDVVNWKPDEQVLMQHTGGLPGQVEEVPKASQEFYVQKMTIENIFINIDYIPHNLDARHPGGIILNLFEIREFKLALPRIDLKGVRNFQMAGNMAWNWWISHVKDKELYKIIGNIGPFAYFKNFKNALVDIVKGENAPDATKRALVGLIRSATVEGISIFEGVANGVHYLFKGRSGYRYK